VLLWFNAPTDSELAGMPNVKIRLHFNGGCRDGRFFATDPKSLAVRRGYRYCLLALRGQVGMEWREIPVVEYAAISRVLQSYGPVDRLSCGDVEDIIRQLHDVKTHIYAVKRRRETPDEIALVLDFVRVEVGV
jgi:hypothetical protein